MDGEKWNPVTSGLPEPKGTVISMLDTNLEIGGEFYCLNNCGIFCFNDSGIHGAPLRFHGLKNIVYSILGDFQLKYDTIIK